MDDLSISSTPSGLTGAGGGNKLRIVGMATGLDVDGMVNKMLLPHQTRIAQEKIKLQLLQWKQEAYRDIISDVKSLQDEYFNNLKSDSMVTRESNYSAFKVTSGNSDVVNAFASPDAIEGTYEVTVTSIAKGAEIKSSQEVLLKDSTTRALQSTRVGEVGIASGSNIDISLSWDENGVNKTLDKTITVSSDSETIKEFLDKFSVETDGKVAAVFDEISGKVIINSTISGENSNMQIKSTSTTELLDKLHINDTTLKQGTDANFKIKSPYGEEKDVKQSTNVYSANGITFMLANKEGESTTITVKSDVEPVFNMIKGFIEKYNKIVDKIQSKRFEKSNKDFKPLTDEQKKQMSKDEIEKWEAKAKEGILKNDPVLDEMLSGLRRTFFDAVEGAGITFGKEIGLDTSSGFDSETNKFDSNQSGKIMFTENGEAKLKDAIRNNRKKITDLFVKTSYSTDETEKYNNQGIFSRINDVLVKYVGLTGTSLNSGKLTSMVNQQNDYSTYGTASGNTIPDQIFRQNLSIKNLTNKMVAAQERYYSQFSALETAMNRLNTQSAWLSQQLGQ